MLALLLSPPCNKSTVGPFFGSRAQISCPRSVIIVIRESYMFIDSLTSASTVASCEVT